VEKAQPSVDSEEMDQEDNVNHSDDVQDIENESLWDGICISTCVCFPFHFIIHSISFHSCIFR
jgi:hypothetical protein